MRSFLGGCHCGTIRIRFDIAIDPGALEVRACQCSFCRKHASHTGSDPAGRVTIDVAEGVSWYQFGLATCEFAICRRCGIYVAAVLRDGEDAWAVVNLNALDERSAFTSPVVPMDYSTEDRGSRIDRRKTKWTPATVSR